MAQLTTLGDGGMAVLVLGRDMDVPKPFGAHPQLCVLPSADLPMAMSEIAEQFPPNTRIVIVGGMLPSATFGSIQKAAERRQVPWIHRRNTTALADHLAALLKRPEAPSNGAEAAAATVQKKGSVRDLVLELADLTKGAAEETRRLLPLFQQRGVMATFGSLAQAISVAKRKSGATGNPNSLKTPQARALNTLDEAIAAMQLVREYVASTEIENGKLRATIAKMKEVFALSD